MPGADRDRQIECGPVRLDAHITVPASASGWVIFAHGSGSSRHSPRNIRVARVLQASRLGTVLMDLLTAEEERVDLVTGHLRFDITLLAQRLTGAVDWLEAQADLPSLPVGLFGSSTGAAAALVTAARRRQTVRAVVSRGGRPDLAGDALAGVYAPTLLIVGEYDTHVIELNRAAKATIPGESALTIVPGASHLFEEPGTLDEVARLAAGWFGRYLAGRPLP